MLNIKLMRVSDRHELCDQGSFLFEHFKTEVRRLFGLFATYFKVISTSYYVYLMLFHMENLTAFVCR